MNYVSCTHLTELVERLQNCLLHFHLKVCQHAGQHLLHEAAHLQHPPATQTNSNAVIMYVTKNCKKIGGATRTNLNNNEKLVEVL